jgi:hypothetical protein
MQVAKLLGGRMNIREAILSTEIYGLRIEYGDAWLVGNTAGDGFIVYQKEFGARSTKLICETTDEHVAIAALLDIRIK